MHIAYVNEALPHLGSDWGLKRCVGKVPILEALMVSLSKPSRGKRLTGCIKTFSKMYGVPSRSQAHSQLWGRQSMPSGSLQASVKPDWPHKKVRVKVCLGGQEQQIPAQLSPPIPGFTQPLQFLLPFFHFSNSPFPS